MTALKLFISTYYCCVNIYTTGFWSSRKIDFIYVSATLLFTIPAFIVLSYFYIKIKSLKEAEDDLDRDNNPSYSRIERVIAKRVNDLYFLVVNKCQGVCKSCVVLHPELKLNMQHNNIPTFGTGLTRIARWGCTRITAYTAAITPSSPARQTCRSAIRKAPSTGPPVRMSNAGTEFLENY